MTEQDREGFALLMLGIGETYGESVSDARMELYFAALADLELAELRAAATAHVRTSKFFPRPAELREAIDGRAEDRAELAWIDMLQLVRRYGFWQVPPAEAWPDNATRAAAMSMYGGWKALCSKLPGEGPELLGAAKLFKASFVAMDAAEKRGDMLPLGRELGELEARNAMQTALNALKARGLPTGNL